MEEKLKWVESNGIYYPTRFVKEPIEKLEQGIYQVYKSKTPFDQKIGLQLIEPGKFKFDFKLYDLGTEEIETRIINTWNSDIFKATNKNLGVIYNGVKGTGKTVGAKVLCNKFDLPVIVVSEYEDGLLEFIQSLDFECIIFLDEAEKVFSGEERDQLLLKVIDGVFSSSRKLFILTTNNLSINTNLIDRPSRIRYIKEFEDISSKSIDELLTDYLIDKSLTEEVKTYIKRNLRLVTVDIVLNIIQEINIHGSLPGNCLNIASKSYTKKLLTIKPGDNFDILSMEDISNIRKELLKVLGNTKEINNRPEGEEELKIVYPELDLSEYQEYVDKDYTSYDLSDILGWVVDKYFHIAPKQSDYESHYRCSVTHFSFWTNDMYIGLVDENKEHKVINMDKKKEVFQIGELYTGNMIGAFLL